MGLTEKAAFLKGLIEGSDLNLDAKQKKIFDALGGGSNASYAIRFAASQEGVMMVLSGMGDMTMMADNISYMKDFRPLDQAEQAAVEQVCAIFRELGGIPCPGCRYCTEVCPQGIAIPDLFSLLNAHRIWNNWNTAYYYHNISTKEGTKAKDCLGCGACEGICPQHLQVRELLKAVSAEFDK